MAVPSEVEILRAQVELLREAHDMASQALRSSMSIAEREGKDTHWSGHRAQVRAALDAYFAADDCFRSIPRADIQSSDRGGDQT